MDIEDEHNVKINKREIKIKKNINKYSKKKSKLKHNVKNNHKLIMEDIREQVV